MVMVSRGGWLVAFSRGERAGDGTDGGWRMEGGLFGGGWRLACHY